MELRNFKRPDGSIFSLPLSWLEETGLSVHLPDRCRYIGDASTEFVLQLAEIRTPHRAPGVVLDHGGFARSRMVSALRGISTGQALPPLQVVERDDGVLGYVLADGMHRYHACCVLRVEEVSAIISGLAF